MIYMNLFNEFLCFLVKFLMYFGKSRRCYYFPQGICILVVIVKLGSTVVCEDIATVKGFRKSRVFGDSGFPFSEFSYILSFFFWKVITMRKLGVCKLTKPKERKFCSSEEAKQSRRREVSLASSLTSSNAMKRESQHFIRHLKYARNSKHETNATITTPPTPTTTSHIVLYD